MSFVVAQSPYNLKLIALHWRRAWSRACAVRVRRTALRLLVASLTPPVQEAATGQGTRSLTVYVREAERPDAVVGAIVSLFDSTKQRVVAVLTDANGVAVLAAPREGRYVVHAERVGVEASVTRSIQIGRHPSSIVIEMSGRRVILAAVKVRAERACDSDPTSGEGTAALWNEVRKTLTSTLLTAAEERARSVGDRSVRRYYRTLDRHLRVERESSAAIPYTGTATFRSASADSLSRRGYMHRSGAELTYFAPDADVLVSDAFAGDHCFSVVRRQSGDSALIGLEFRPARGRTLPDVRGVLWLNASTSALSHLEYQYENLPDSLTYPNVGGRVAFVRVSHGRWVVARWHIRVPRLGIVGPQRVGVLQLDRRTELIGYHEEGGILSAGGPLRVQNESVLVVYGVLYDSTVRAPLSGARVYVKGVTGSDTTNADGSFQLRLPLPGDYTLAASHSRLTLFGIEPLERPLSLKRAGRAVRVDLAVPSAQALVRQRCDTSTESGAPKNLLVGIVGDSMTGVPIPQALVTVSWAQPKLQRGAVIATGMSTWFIEALTDERGAYAVCHVPQDTSLTVRATKGTLRGEQTITTSRDERLAVLPLSLVRYGVGGTVQGRIIVKGSDRPLAGAGIHVTGIDQSAQTNASGWFRMDNVPEGRHSYQVRALGYAPWRGQMLVTRGDTTNLTAALEALAPELAQVHVEALAPERGLLAGFERRRALRGGGSFIDRAALEANQNAKLSDVLRRLATGIQLVRLRGSGQAAASGRGRLGINSSTAQWCFMQIFLDGVKVFGPSVFSARNPPPNLDEYLVRSLAAVEVYVGPSSTPSEFAGSDAACGTIAIWTRD